jgi:hypothetical protein
MQKHQLKRGTPFVPWSVLLIFSEKMNNIQHYKKLWCFWKLLHSEPQLSSLLFTQSLVFQLNQTYLSFKKYYNFSVAK